jgi:hypothetical protein
LARLREAVFFSVPSWGATFSVSGKHFAVASGEKEKKMERGLLSPFFFAEKNYCWQSTMDTDFTQPC